MTDEIVGIQDGDQGPYYGFEVWDQGVLRDMSSAAVEFKIEDQDGNAIATRAGVVMDPKSLGQVQLLFRGRETDWSGLGAGGGIVVKPKAYYATAPDGTPAVNALTNGSFDTDTSPADGIADGWAVLPATTGSYAVQADDSAPPAIFRNCQLASPAAGTATEFLYQDLTPGGGIVVGDRWTVGAFFRGDRISGAASDGHALILELFQGGTLESVITRLPVGSSDWGFVMGTMVASQAGNTKARIKLALNNSNLGSRRFDEAFLFKGYWRVRHLPPFTLPVPGRSRVPKSASQVQGRGSFEQDSDADGLADGFVKLGSANTYTIERDPARVAHGSSSQKIVLANPASERIFTRKRERYKAGDVWSASIKVMTLGALAGAGGGFGFGLALHGDTFDGGITQESALAVFGSNLAVFTTYTAQITLLADRDVLVVEVNLSGYTGTAWIDDLRLWRVSP